MKQVRYSYDTVEFDEMDIHVRTLRDRQQYADKDDVAHKLGINSAVWPISCVIWPSGRVLANLMYDYEIDGKRILEVGCGIGLASLVLNKRCANITATDYHPEVEDMLTHNSNLNDCRIIPFILADWSNELNIDLGTFDVVIGSDIIYFDEHANILPEFIDRHTNQTSEIIIVDPCRGLQNKFTDKMIALGYTSHHKKGKKDSYPGFNFSGRVMKYSRE